MTVRQARPGPPKLTTAPPGIRFGVDVYADHVLRREGMGFIEDLVGLPVATILDRWLKPPGRIDLNPVLVALLLQRNVRMSTRRALEHVRTIDCRDLARQFDALGPIKVEITGYPRLLISRSGDVRSDGANAPSRPTGQMAHAGN